jgi:MarR family transcriptional regulator, transcriptional regulator for hemolysin
MAITQSSIQAELGLLVTRLGRVWRRKADQALSAHGLSEATAHPLLILSRRGNSIRQGMLADEMGIEGPSLVRLIDLLQAEGLVERREDPTDRRAKMLHITALGETKVAQINRVIGRVRAELMADVSADELAVTFDVLRKIELSAHKSLKTAEEAEALS